MSKTFREAQTHTTWLIESQTDIIGPRLTTWSGKSRIYDCNLYGQHDNMLLTKYSVIT